MFDKTNKENNSTSLITEDHPLYINIDWKTILKYAKKDLEQVLYITFKTTVKNFLDKAVKLYDSAKSNKTRFQELVNKCSKEPKILLSEAEKNGHVNDDVLLKYTDFLQFRKNIKEHEKEYGNKFTAAFDVLFIRCILYIKKSVAKKSVHFREEIQLDFVHRAKKEDAKKLTTGGDTGFFAKPDECHKRKFSGTKDDGANSKKIQKFDDKLPLRQS